MSLKLNSQRDSKYSFSSIEFDDGLLLVLLGENHAVSAEEYAIKLRSKHTTVHSHLQQNEKDLKFRKWAPYKSFEFNYQSRADICSSFYSRKFITPFLNRLLTGDKKWTFCKSVKLRRQWFGNVERPKGDLHANELLSIWWDCKRIIHSNLLPTNVIINTPVYF